ncbi:hypothetical protein FRC08_010187 [Ceratobasidium sp. 394]|nr:hypothetical protein FRC08_010187 [Ceratobasidium sp. 394]
MTPGGKGKKLYKYDVPPPEKGEKRSPHRLVFHFESIDEYDQVAVVNFCGVEVSYASLNP